jgi:hypothetical protein
MQGRNAIMIRAYLSIALLASVSLHKADANDAISLSRIKFNEALLACGIDKDASSKCNATTAITNWCVQHLSTSASGEECIIPIMNHCGAGCVGEPKAIRVDFDCVDRNGAIVEQRPIVHSTRLNVTIKCVSGR